MRDAVIVGTARTPVGKRGGGLSGIHPVDLSGQLLSAFPERVDENIMYPRSGDRLESES